MPLRAGEVVVAQGSEPDYLYVITQGRCTVTRRASDAGRELQLDVLREGDIFGEGALISGTPQTTSVQMLTNGVLMRLDRTSFERLVRDPTLRMVSYDEARRIVGQGGRWLDVRTQDACTDPGFEGSLDVPHQLLALEAPAFDRTRPYVVYCESGTHSASSAFLLTRLGFDAYVVDGGLEGVRSNPAQTPAVEEIELKGMPMRGTAEPGAVEESVERQGKHTVSLDPVAILDRIHALSAAVGAALATAEKAQKEARAENRHNEDLTRLLGMHRARNSTLQFELERARGDAARRIEADRKRLSQRLRKARRRVRAAGQAAASDREGLEQACVGLERERSELEGKCAELERERGRLERDRGKLEQKCSELAQERGELEDRCHFLERERKSLEQTGTDLGQRCQGMSAEIESTLKMLKYSTAALRDVRHKRRGLEQEFERTRLRLEEALADKDGAVAERRQAESALAAALDAMREDANLLSSLQWDIIAGTSRD